jgi:organic hydroperoxide reductase OsmC/OhrA
MHHYQVTIQWTGNTGSGTSHYQQYERSHTIQSEGKPIIEGSSDPAFRGDAAKYNPEELLLSALSSCHMLWFLHLCSTEKIVVVDYIDQANGEMIEHADGSGQFIAATLHPTVTVEHPVLEEKINHLHHLAHQKCFIANSVNFPVKQVAKLIIASASS